MPQMAPMWWDILYIIFTIMFLTTNMINYWTNFKYKKTKEDKSKINMKWMW